MKDAIAETLPELILESYVDLLALRKERGKPCSIKSQALSYRAVLIDNGDLEDALCQVYCDSRRVHERTPSGGLAVVRNLSLAQRCRNAIQEESISPLEGTVNGGWLRAMRTRTATLMIAYGMTGCVSLAPGADKVRLTRDAPDVVTCTAVGNVRVPVDVNRQVDIANATTLFRNRVVALGGNTGFVTNGPLNIPVGGVAYSCP